MIQTERLIIFTRYPEAGKAKTRLIPALGSEGAAQLQRQMTEWAIAQARRLATIRDCAIEVHFTQNQPLHRIQAWLGADLHYFPQAEGDLGVKLTVAVAAAFASKADRVVVIGTDCPSLTVELLDRAFNSLEDHEVALGQATDGGYYLIVLRSFQPALFEQIAWSTEVVFAQTIDRARQQNLMVATLPELTDIDRPADLAVWQQVQADRPQLAIVIPTLNEAHAIEQILRFAQHSNLEVIVADGGSDDETVPLAQSLGAIVVQCDRGRAQQMNEGAKLATADCLLFLHADTRLPVDFYQTIAQILARSNVVAGAFRLGIDGAEIGLRLVEWGANWRSRLLQLPYGDQALFLRRETFWQLGGFPNLPMMEDFEFALRLRKIGRIAIAPHAVLTSPRRWQKLGVLKTTAINQIAIAAYLIGISPDRIARWYRRQ